jgi:hypothetical protein
MVAELTFGTTLQNMKQFCTPYESVVEEITLGEARAEENTAAARL